MIQFLRMEGAHTTKSSHTTWDGMGGCARQELHVLFRNGVRAAACGREDRSVDLTLVGEVCIVLEDFLKADARFRERAEIAAKVAMKFMEIYEI